jgi:hypothetical protein
MDRASYVAVSSLHGKNSSIKWKLNSLSTKEATMSKSKVVPVPRVQVYQKECQGSTFFAQLVNHNIKVYKPGFAQSIAIKSFAEGRRILDVAGFQLQKGGKNGQSIVVDTINTNTCPVGSC